MHKQREIKLIYLAIILVFGCFLIFPIGSLLIQSFYDSGNLSLKNYIETFETTGFTHILKNSFVVSGLSAFISVSLAFMVAYTLNYTNVFKSLKYLIRNISMLPMLLPTITYGFAIIYTFGKQGLLTKLFGFQLFDIYGFKGLLLGYIIYTFPIAFMLINNAIAHIDKKFILVSKLMGDKAHRTLITTLFYPLLGVLVGAFIQAFFLSFTDFGIPASLGGKYEVIASVLYNKMLGSIPDFASGAVVSVIMLIPSIVSIVLLQRLEKYNVRYNTVSKIEIKKNHFRDTFWGSVSIISSLIIIAIFAVIIIIPFAGEWPYRIKFTFDNIMAVFNDSLLLDVIKNSLIVAMLSAIVGTFVVYGATLVSVRSNLSSFTKKIIESIALVTNTIPGMVLGIAYLLMFSGTGLQNTYIIIVLCNVIHFFSSPYLMMKNTLTKMNGSFEITAKLMGDSWFKTVVRVITPNAISSILEVFSYYFINSMVTVSAVIFITGAKTMVMTTKIKELQHFAKFNEIFVLSILILLINLGAKGLFNYFNKEKGES